MSVSYHYPATNALKYFKVEARCKTVCLLGDPPHLPVVYRNLAAKYQGNLEYLEQSTKRVVESKYGKRILANLDSSRRSVDAIYACAAHHAEDYERLFGRRVDYARTQSGERLLVKMPSLLN